VYLVFAGDLSSCACRSKDRYDSRRISTFLYRTQQSKRQKDFELATQFLIDCSVNRMSCEDFHCCIPSKQSQKHRILTAKASDRAKIVRRTSAFQPDASSEGPRRCRVSCVRFQRPDLSMTSFPSPGTHDPGSHTTRYPVSSSVFPVSSAHKPRICILRRTLTRRPSVGRSQ
jgi:hypothetical protein